MLQQLPFLTIVFQAASIVSVFGHGNIVVPKPSGNSEHPYYIGGPAGTINMAELVEGIFECGNTEQLNLSPPMTSLNIHSRQSPPRPITCKSSSEFVFYWQALHVQPWQVHVNCVALDGSAARSSSVNSTSTTSQTSRSSMTTEAQSIEGSVESEAPEAAESTSSTTKTSSTAATPTVATSKCTGRRSRS
ncbi:hypothetical protein DVH05_028292 [Phytophthora capsici]|nr:hypothetical protein DVH05_028292 [Phytophthora capsici]